MKNDLIENHTPIVITIKTRLVNIYVEYFFLSADTLNSQRPTVSRYTPGIDMKKGKMMNNLTFTFPVRGFRSQIHDGYINVYSNYSKLSHRKQWFSDIKRCQTLYGLTPALFCNPIISSIDVKCTIFLKLDIECIFYIDLEVIKLMTKPFFRKPRFLQILI